MKMKKRARSDLEMEGADAPLTLSLAPQAPHQTRPAEAWSQVRVEFRRALALRSETQRAGDSQRCSQE
jgi:hypothetical protein